MRSDRVLRHIITAMGAGSAVMAFCCGGNVEGQDAETTESAGGGAQEDSSAGGQPPEAPSSGGRTGEDGSDGSGGTPGAGGMLGAGGAIWNDLDGPYAPDVVLRANVSEESAGALLMACSEELAGTTQRQLVCLKSERAAQSCTDAYERDNVGLLYSCGLREQAAAICGPIRIDPPLSARLEGACCYLLGGLCG